MSKVGGDIHEFRGFNGTLESVAQFTIEPRIGQRQQSPEPRPY
jgi:hypothetical protein